MKSTHTLLKDPAQAIAFFRKLRTPAKPKPSPFQNLNNRLQDYQERFHSNPLKHGLRLYVLSLILASPIYYLLIR